MNSLFAKNMMNTEAAISFWAWFEKNEAWISNNIAQGNPIVVRAIDDKLRPVFPYYQEEVLDIMFGYADGEGEFCFFHCGNKHLARDAKTFSKMMPAEVAKRWKFLIAK